MGDAAWERPCEPLPEYLLNDLKKVSAGWLARYELFALEDQSVPQGSTDLPLQDAEIFLLLRQSLRISAFKTWTLTFPMAISSDLSTIIVLRTAFAFDIGLAIDNLPMKYTSATFPLYSSKWSESRPFFDYTVSYEWLISFDNQFVLYHSFDRSPRTNEPSEPLKIFRIAYKVNIEVDQINTINIDELRFNGKNYNDDFFWALHPRKPQFIFSAYGAVWLADFEGGAYFESHL